MKALLIIVLTLAASSSTMVAQAPDPNAPLLTLQLAEQQALKNNPRIAVSRLLALAEGQMTREARAPELPLVTGSLTAVDSHAGSRITAGALNNPIVYERAAGGITLNQLLTDFGRTRDLVRSAELRASAQQSAATATQADVVLATDEAFYRALGSQAVLRVAKATVAARQQVADQVSALTAAKLKSTLDLNFANVNLAQAKLLLLDAQNESVAAMTALSAVLGNEQAATFNLVDETPVAPAPAPVDAEVLVTQALQNRPDLVALNQRFAAAKQFSAAERDLNRPSISALGAVGGTPARSDLITSSWYGAVGVNVNIPVFNGFLFSARANEAAFRADAAGKDVAVLRDAIARDVRTTVLQAQSNFERITVTQQLLAQANSALDLAQTRYQLGLSSIVELTQAQLAQTEAEISYATARYSYQGSLATIRFQTGQ